MTAARNITDADAEVIAELVVAKMRARPAQTSARPSTSVAEQKARGREKARRLMKERGLLKRTFDDPR